jgi:hypothetical protein
VRPPGAGRDGREDKREALKMTIALFELEKHMENIKMYAKRLAANIKEGNRKAGQVWRSEGVV